MGERRGSKLRGALEALGKVYGKEGARNPGDAPLDHVVYGIIAGRSPQRSARAAFARLQKGFVDWNELRVAETREIVEHLGGIAERAELHARAELLRRTLQALFDARDTVRIVFEDPTDEEEVVRALRTVPGLSPGLVTSMLARARPDPPIRLDAGISRVAQRLGVIPRTGGEAKQEAALAAAAGPGEARVLLHFLLGEHAEAVCVPNRPSCEECVCLESCDYGRRRGAEG